MKELGRFLGQLAATLVMLTVGLIVEGLLLKLFCIVIGIEFSIWLLAMLLGVSIILMCVSKLYMSGEE